MLINILIFIQVLLALAFFSILLYICYVMISFRRPVPFVPTPGKVIKQMVKLANIQKGELICDLGSGTGKIIIAAAKQAKFRLVLGIEKAFLLRLATKIKLLWHPFLRKRVQVINKDFYNVDLHNFDVVFCFLTPEALRLLTPQFQTLKSGGRIITYMFHIDEIPGFHEEIKYLSSKDTLYIYRKI